MSEPVRRALPPSVFARLADATRYVITGVSPDTWFGPLQPLAPMAPPEVKGRQWDYPFGANLNYIPRSDDGVSFAELRGLADALPLLRSVIETRKDQIAAQSYAVRPRDRRIRPQARRRSIRSRASSPAPTGAIRSPTGCRMLLEEMLVIDAATIYPRYNRGGSLYSLDIIDGATIKPLIGEDGRAPEPPDPAYQQILKGIPAADFSAEELLYLPRNLRAHRLYGMSPVEQIALTVNIALRRDASTLDYYRAGSSPDAFATLPKEWTADQIRSFQDYFDALMSGNLARRRQTKFMPADFKLIEARQPPLKDQYDEWLARIICYAFSVPVSPFVQPGQPRDRRDHAPAGDAGRAGAAEGVGEERARPCDPGLHERAGPRVRLGRRRRGRSAGAGADAADPGRRRHQDARGGAGGSGPRADGWRNRAKRHKRCRICRCDSPCKRRLQRFLGLEQKENISLTAYAAFPVAPIFMIWSFAWGTVWTCWPCVSTGFSTYIFLNLRASRPQRGLGRLPIEQLQSFSASSQLCGDYAALCGSGRPSDPSPPTRAPARDRTPDGNGGRVQ